MLDPTTEDIEEVWNDRLDGCSVAWIVRNGTTGLSRRAVIKILEGPVPDRFRGDPRLLPYRFIWIAVSGAVPLPDGSQAPFIFLKVPRKIAEADFRKGCTKLKRALAEAAPEARLETAAEQIESGIVLKFMRDKGYLGWELGADGSLSPLAIEAIEPEVEANTDRPPGP